VFGGVPYIRSAEDIAYNVALFIAKRGSYVNYYMVSLLPAPCVTASLFFIPRKSLFCLLSCVMDYLDLMQYHGGTNFDRIASAFVTTSYYDEAPLDEYGVFLSFLHLSKSIDVESLHD